MADAFARGVNAIFHVQSLVVLIFIVVCLVLFTAIIAAGVVMNADLFTGQVRPPAGGADD